MKNYSTIIYIHMHVLGVKGHLGRFRKINAIFIFDIIIGDYVCTFFTG